MKKSVLITVLGPTASGKSALAVNLAKKFNGEVVSCDSRQVYRGMDLGSGKITKKEMKGIPHHLLDVVSPKKRFDVVQYRKLAQRAINEIMQRDKVPILCGGTGFYIQAVVDGIVIPTVKPDWRLRKKLERKSVEELYQMLQKLDPRRAGNIDKNNPRRLIRAIEIVIKTKKPVPRLRQDYGGQAYPVLIIGIKKTPAELKTLIRKRLLKRLKSGMVAEVKRLHNPPTGGGVSWKKLEEFGLEYRWIARYLKTIKDFRNPLKLKGISEINKSVNFRKSDFFYRLQKETEHFAKRQETWFKRDKRIRWIKNQKEAEKLIKRFFVSR